MWVYRLDWHVPFVETRRGVSLQNQSIRTESQYIISTTENPDGTNPSQRNNPIQTKPTRYLFPEIPNPPNHLSPGLATCV